jgi:hypothetical protein
MRQPPVSAEAVLQPDGVTLRLTKKISLPPGQVIVTVQPATSGAGPRMIDVLDRIRRERMLRGARPMSEDQMRAEIEALRAEGEEDEARWREIWSKTQLPLPGE